MIRNRAPSQLPVIGIGMLKRAGLFDENHRGWIGFWLGSVEAIFAYSREKNALAVVTFANGKIYPQYISLSYSKLRFGRRRYFYCYKSDVRCNDLVFAEGEFASRVSWRMGRGPLHSNQRRHEGSRHEIQRLLGSETKGPARGKNRSKLLATIEPNAWLRLVTPEQADTVAALRIRAELGRKRAVASPMAMAVAFNKGQRVRSSLDRELSSDQLARFGATRPLGVRHLPRAFVDDFPFLAIGDLSRRKLLKAGTLSAWTLPWSDAVHLIIECHLYDPDQAFVAARSRYTGDAQILRLRRTGSQAKWCFVCPFTGQPMTKAFFRDGLFGSVAGNHLIHRSQRKAG